jgi:hypothetical protein
MARTGANKAMCTGTYLPRDPRVMVKKAPPPVPSQSDLQRLKEIYGGGNKKTEQ